MDYIRRMRRDFGNVKGMNIQKNQMGRWTMILLYLLPRLKGRLMCMYRYLNRIGIFWSTYVNKWRGGNRGNANFLEWLGFDTVVFAEKFYF